MAEKRDLKADLKYLSDNPSITELMELAEEAVDRAIEAEKLAARAMEYAKDPKIISLEDIEGYCALVEKNAALREENDIQRQSIQNLSCQVAALRKAIKQIHCYIHPHNSPRYSEFIDDVCDEVLCSPDPGAKVKAVIKLTKDYYKINKLLNSTESDMERANINFVRNRIYAELEQALAALKGVE